MIPILQSLSASLARKHVTVAATAPEVDGSRYPWAIGQWFKQPLSASSKPKGNGVMSNDLLEPNCTTAVSGVV